MFLIAESGSTKTDWALVDGEMILNTFSTTGLNPFLIDNNTIKNTLSEGIVKNIKTDIVKIDNIYFYGAGCSTKNNINFIKKYLSQYFENAGIIVEHDLLAAARALLSNKSGFVAILGTGTNTGLYNGKKIVRSIDSLGYILGDEGSGSYIGKKILGEFMRGYMPKDLGKKFDKEYNISRAEIFENLNKKPLPNRFLGNFCRFAEKYIEHEYIRDIVTEAFNDFFMNIVIRYPSYGDLELNSCGSVGFVFRDILKKVSASFGMMTGKIIRSPINDLVKYHIRHIKK